MRERYRTAAHVLLLAAAGLAAYANTFHAPFQFDDVAHIVENPLIKSFSLLFHPLQYCEQFKGTAEQDLICQALSSRFAGYFTFALNYRLNGLAPGGYHVVNLLFHIVNACLVYVLVVLTFRTPFFRTPGSGRNAQLIALFSGLFFVVHPVQTQAVTYIVQRFTSLTTLFFLLSLVLYVQWRLGGRAADNRQQTTEDRQQRTDNGGQTTEDRRKSVNLKHALWYAASFLSAVLAMKTKQIAFTLPVIITVYEPLFFDGPIRRRLYAVVPFFLTMIIVPLDLIGAGKPLGELIGEMDRTTRVLTSISRWEYLLTQFRVIVTYMRLLLFPVDQNLDYDYPVRHSLFEGEVFFSFLLLLLFFSFGAYLLSRARTVSPSLRLTAFGIFWFFITLSVESSVIPIVDVIFEHRVYLPSAGFFVFFTSGLFVLAAQVKGTRSSASRVLVTALVLGVALLTGTAVARNSVWRSDVSLWQDVIAKSPQKGRGYINLAAAYQDRKEPQKAIETINIVLASNPELAQAYYSRGYAYSSLEACDKALDDYAKAISLDPNYAQAYNSRGFLYYKLGRLDDALRDYSKALSLNPHLADAYNNRGVYYLRTGRYDSALKDWEKAIMIDPDKAEHYSNIGSVYLERGELDRAIEEYTKAISKQPDLAEAHLNRGLTYGKKKMYKESLRDLDVAIALKPLHSEAYLTRGKVFLALGMKAEAAKDFQRACDIGNAMGCGALKSFRKKRKE